MRIPNRLRQGARNTARALGGVGVPSSLTPPRGLDVAATVCLKASGPTRHHTVHRDGRLRCHDGGPVDLLRPALLGDDDASHTSTAVKGPLTVISPVWSTTESKRKGGGAKRGKRRKVELQPASDTGPYVGKWFVQAPSEIRDEALNARDWVLRQDDAESDEDEFVDAAELARLRAL
jgi:hypothetical protein